MPWPLAKDSLINRLTLHARSPGQNQKHRRRPPPHRRCPCHPARLPGGKDHRARPRRHRRRPGWRGFHRPRRHLGARSGGLRITLPNALVETFIRPGHRSRRHFLRTLGRAPLSCRAAEHPRTSPPLAFVVRSFLGASSGYCSSRRARFPPRLQPAPPARPYPRARICPRACRLFCPRSF